MAKTVPKTKAGKQAKTAKILHEWKQGALHSSSGQKVTSQEQALAIAMSATGQARKKGKK